MKIRPIERYAIDSEYARDHSPPHKIYTCVLFASSNNDNYSQSDSFLSAMYDDRNKVIRARIKSTAAAASIAREKRESKSKS